MEKRSRYETELAAMPPGLGRAVLRVISGYQEARPVSRTELVTLVGMQGFTSSERQIREMIRTLRRQGYLICSVAGEDGGYFMAQTKLQYDEFRRREFASKISDMSETMRAMDDAARDQFGDGYQLGLGL